MHHEGGTIRSWRRRGRVLRRGEVAAWVLCAAVLQACAGGYRAADRPWERDSARAVLRPLWTRTLVHQDVLSYRPQEWASAAIGRDRTVYIGSSAGQMLAFGRDGQILWRFPVQGAISSQPLLHEPSKTLYFGADDGQLYALNAETGQQRWNYKTEGTIAHPPAYSQNGTLLFTTSEDRIYGVDAAQGTWRWQYDRERPEGFSIHGFSGVTVHGALAYTGFSDGMVVALRPATGEVVWTRFLGEDAEGFLDADATPRVMGDRLLCAGYATGVYALGLQTGAVEWRFALPGVTAIEVGSALLFAVAPKTGIVALSPDGAERWRQAIQGGVPARPTLARGHVLVSASDAGVYIASAKTGRLLQYLRPRSGVSASAAVGAGLVIVLSNYGLLYAFEHAAN